MLTPPLGLLIEAFAVTDLPGFDKMSLVVDLVSDPTVTDSHPVAAVRPALQSDCSGWSRVLGQCSKLSNHLDSHLLRKSFEVPFGRWGQAKLVTHSPNSAKTSSAGRVS